MDKKSKFYEHIWLIFWIKYILAISIDFLNQSLLKKYCEMSPTNPSQDIVIL